MEKHYNFINRLRSRSHSEVKRKRWLIILFMVFGMFMQLPHLKANVGEDLKASISVIDSEEGYFEFRIPVFEDDGNNSSAKMGSYLKNNSSGEVLFYFGCPSQPSEGQRSIKYRIKPMNKNQGRIKVYHNSSWTLVETADNTESQDYSFYQSGGSYVAAYMRVRYYPKAAGGVSFSIFYDVDYNNGSDYTVTQTLTSSYGITPPTANPTFSYSYDYNKSPLKLDFTAKIDSKANRIGKVSTDGGTTKVNLPSNSPYETKFTVDLDESNFNQSKKHNLIYYWVQDIPDKYEPLIKQSCVKEVIIPAYNQAKNDNTFKGVYDQKSGKVTVNWTVDIGSHSSTTGYVSGGKFQLQRATNSSFSNDVESFDIDFVRNKSSYSFVDDVAGVSNNQIIYYRIRRVSPPDNWYNTTSAWGTGHRSMQVSGITPAEHTTVKDAKVTLDKKTAEATITWTSSSSYWSDGSEFVIEKYNETEKKAVLPNITLEKVDYEKRKYVDKELSTCIKYSYKAYVKPGKSFFSTQRAISVTGDTILITDIGTISNVKASKGYYSDYTTVEWKAIGAFDEFIIKRIEYGKAGESVQIGTIPATLSETYSFDDTRAVAGTFYKYSVVGVIKCNNEQTKSPEHGDIGFRAPTGNIYGRVTFESGQGVIGADIRLSSKENVGGSSIKFGGTNNDYLETDSVLTQTGTAYTMQAYVMPETSNSTGSVLKKGVYELGVTNGKPFFQAGSTKIESTEIIKGGKYSHISGAYTTNNGKDSLYLYIYTTDTTLVHKKAVATVPAVASGKVIIGKAFKGNVDEVRIWNRGLDKNEIERDYNRLLSGNESELQAYWRFNDPIETEFYDCSYRGAQYNENHGKIYGNVSSSNLIPTEYQLAFRGVTDDSGNYRITGIPYSGNGTEYTLTPYYGIHQFSPLEKTIILGTSSASFNIDFVDKSSFKVSGIVYYENSRVPVADVLFYIDGMPAAQSNGELIKSDDKGIFSINVPVGVHEVKAMKQNHTFLNGGKLTNSFGSNLNYQDDITGVRLWDNTTVRLIGRVVGGNIQESYPIGHSKSTNNLGDEITLTLKLKDRSGDIYIIEDDNGNIIKNRKDTTLTHYDNKYSNDVTYSREQIQIKANPKTGEYIADVMPEVYNVTAINITGYGNLIENVAKVVDMSSSFIESTSLYPEIPIDNKTPQDTVKYNGEFSYRLDVNPVFTFYEVKDTVSCTPKTFFGSEQHKISIYTDKGNEEFLIPLYDKDKKEYAFEKPVYKIGGWYNFLIESYYPYYFNNDAQNNLDKVPVSDGKVSLTNTFKNETVSLKLNEMGKAAYRFQADNPDVNGLFKGLRDIQMSVTVDNYTTSSQKMEAYLLGGLSKGQDFVTEGPNSLLMVLRDPPGSKSYAYAEKGITITNTKNEIKNGFFQEGEEILEHMLGIKLTTSVGIGFTTDTEVESEDNLGVQVTHHEEGQEDHVSIDEITTITRFQTSDDPLYVGANGDLLIGHSNNVILGVLDEIDIKPTKELKAEDISVKDFSNGYSLYTGSSLSIGTKFNTLFAYPQIHIEEVIIPQIEKMIVDKLEMGLTPTQAQAKADTENRAVYVSKLNKDDKNFGKPNPGAIIKEDGPYYTIYFPAILPEAAKKDSIETLYSSKQNWIDLLFENEREKVKAQKVTGKQLQNYSLQAGSNIEHSVRYSHTSDTTKTFSFQVGAGLHGQIGATLNGFGIRFSSKESAGKIGGYANSSGTTNEQTIGFVLADDGDFDYMSVDVVTLNADSSAINAGKVEGNFVYRLRGGATACPYEGPEFTKYYEPGKHKISEGSVQVEKPKLKVDPESVSNIPSNNPAVFTLTLYNESEAKADSWFDLKLVDSTIPNGAKFSIDGVPLSDGRTFLVSSGEILTKTLEVRMGAGSYDYENMKLVLTSQCQCDPTTFQEVIADTINLSVHFIPTSTPVKIKSPGNNWVLNTTCDTLPKGKYYIPVTIHDFDVNYRDFDRIELQYKPISESKQWSVLKTFYADQKRVTKPEEEEYIGKQTTLTANFTGEEDQKYDIRAVSYCKYGAEEITYESEIISGLKDIKRPVLFGSAQPADGILGVGDEVQLNFSEDLADGYLTDANFEVTAIKNGAAGDHNVSVKFDGQNDYLSTEFDRNLNNKSLTVEMWVQPSDINRAGTLFSHGNLNEAFEISLTADSRIEVVFGQKTYKSSVITLKDGEWFNLAVTYDADKQYLIAYYDYNEVISEGNVSPYTGIGRFEFGRKVNATNYFAGNMHEVRIWEKAVSVADIKAKGLTILSGIEPSLMAYYPMNEAKGTLVTDKARGNNAVLAGEWNTLAGKAITFNGIDGLAAINSSEIAVKADQDFTMEFWFRSAKTDLVNAALVNNGKADGNEIGTSDNKFFIGFENGKMIFRSKEHSEEIDGSYLDQTWHHFALSVNRVSGNAQVFIDGELKKYFDSNYIGSISGPYIYMGACLWTEKSAAIDHTEQFFAGQIDEFRLWNGALPQSVISSRNNIKMDGDEMGLVAFYPFEKWIVNSANVREMVFTTEDMVAKKYSIDLKQGAAETDIKAPLKSKGPEEPILHTFVVNKDALIITLTEPEERIEKTIVNFAVKRVRDVNGNESDGTIRWSAYIDRNQLKWSETEIVKEKKQYEPLEFVVTLNNTGGSVKNYTLDNLPAWLSATPMSGRLSPKGSQKVTFVVDEGINVGSYDEVIYARGENNVAEPLSLELKVNAEKPKWTVNPEDFKYNMSIFGKLRFNNIFSADKEDMLAAFKDGKCVGVANCSYDKTHDLWYVFLTVYSNEIQSDNVEFRMWDNSTGKMYSASPDKEIKFINDQVFGTAKNPIIFDGKEIVYQNIDLKKGWNWTSFNLSNPNGSDVTSTLANGVWTSNDMIKDANNFDSYSPNNKKWVGTLSNAGGLNHTSLYIIHSDNAQVLSTYGTMVNTQNTRIPVKGNNWNYISYLPGVNLTLKEALGGYDAKDGDIVKSQSQFAMYSGNGWIGSLTYMEAGKGYMLLRKSNDDVSFIYPSTKGSLGKALHTDMSDDNAYLNTNYANNMTVVAVGSDVEKYDRILAYVNGELRGISENVETDGKDMKFITIAGADSENKVSFQLERNGSIIAQANTMIAYNSNSVKGTIDSPLVLDFNQMNGKATLYPVPFDTELNIDLMLEEDSQLKIAVYDLSGRFIWNKNEKAAKGMYHTTWNGSSYSPGIYLVYITINGETSVYKVIKK